MRNLQRCFYVSGPINGDCEVLQPDAVVLGIPLTEDGSPAQPETLDFAIPDHEAIYERVGNLLVYMGTGEL